VKGRAWPEGAGVAAVLAAVLLLGGAGRSYPLLEAAVEALSAALLAAVVARHGLLPWLRRDWLAAAVIALALALPVLQLLPVPFGTWAQLPGRALPAGVLHAAGIAPAAMPITLDPAGTRGALLALLPGIALFAAARNLTPKGRRLAISTVLALAAFGACLGAVQVVMGKSASAPAFASNHLGFGIGMFVNRNHQAAFLLVAICLAAARLRRASGRQTAIAAGLILLFGAAVLATTSRTALALLPLCLLPAAGRLRGGRLIGAAGALLVCAGFGWWAWWGGALTRVFERFGGEPDIRFAFWRTTWRAVHEYWPLGSGVGSFKAVYPLFEDRADLFGFFVNHAHNDFLELLLEGGLAAAVGLALFAVWYGRRLWQARSRKGGIEVGMLWALAPLLAFSAVDYPLRILALMALFGLLCGLALRPLENAPAPRPVSLPGAALLVTGAAAALAILIVAPRGDAATRTEAEARLALRRTPTSQHALTMLAQAAQNRGDEAKARRLIHAAAPLGWRDPAAQLWLFALLADAGRYDEGLARADALLRMGEQAPTVRAMMRGGAADPRFSEALARMLGANPPWRPSFLLNLADLPQPLASHAALLRDLAKRGAPTLPQERGAFVARAIALDDLAAASAFWQESARTAEGNLLPDSGLHRIDVAGASGLFGWHRTDIEGLTLDGDGQGGTELSVDPAVSGVLLYQTLMLPAGSYSLALPYTAESGAGVRGLGWTLGCATGKWQRLDAQGEVPTAAGAWSARFEVPADCPVQRLGLRSDGTGYEPLRLRIGKARLIPVAPGRSSTPN
jgi:O-antigen ligase